MSLDSSTSIKAQIREELNRYTQDAGTVLAGALELLKATSYAISMDRGPWDFAVSAKELYRIGLSETDLWLLIYAGIAEHQQDVTEAEFNGEQNGCPIPRMFRPGSLCESSCFVLSESFFAIAKQMDYRGASDRATSTVPSLAMFTSPGLSSNPQPPKIPRWDSDRKALYIAEIVVKRFRAPAKNQEQILTAFEEENWPVRIDDPLPPQHEMDSKQRLRDTVKCLKRRQKGGPNGHILIDFRCDGSGEGVSWELTTQARQLLGGKLGSCIRLGRDN